jgi:hypothetical protein
MNFDFNPTTEAHSLLKPLAKLITFAGVGGLNLSFWGWGLIGRSSTRKLILTSAFKLLERCFVGFYSELVELSLAAFDLNGFFTANNISSTFRFKSNPKCTFNL